jgi:hypothetical protein
VSGQPDTQQAEAVCECRHVRSGHGSIDGGKVRCFNCQCRAFRPVSASTAAEELRTAAAALRVAAEPAPPCQHPDCGCCEGWHKQDADGLTVCTGCDYDAHRYVSPGYPMPDGVGPLLADWLEQAARTCDATVVAAARVWSLPCDESEAFIQEQAPHTALALARKINAKTEELPR